ncbi:hypothetical protein [Umezawaea sp. NPDC059074]|uniref:hypothetical protein n=1 Tax=Umezawaea sp. NPDC059074 TaxID=3346716 RepID=UPI00368B4FAE
MDLLSVGSSVVVVAVVPALVMMVVSLVALRGSAPSQRPEIIRALAELLRAFRRDRTPPRRTSTRRKPIALSRQADVAEQDVET